MNGQLTRLIVIGVLLCTTCRLCVAQVWGRDADLVRQQYQRGLQLVGNARVGTTMFYQWENDDGRQVTASLTCVGRNRVHFPDESSFAEFVKLGMQQAEQWIELDAARWHLDKDQQARLRLAAGLQMASLERELRDSLRRLQDVDIETADCLSTLRAVKAKLIEFLNPSFRDRESLYYKILTRVKAGQ
jgi:hypothetical protein